MALQEFRSPASYSLLLHFAFLGMLLLTFNSHMTQLLPKKMTWIEIDEGRTTLRPSAAPLPNSQRYVQTQKPLSESKQTRAAPDAFLGERTQTVDRQSVSRDKKVQVGRSAQEMKKHSLSTLPRRVVPPSQSKLAKSGRQALRSLGLPVLPPQVNSPASDPSQDFSKNQSSLVDEDSTSLASQAPKEYLKGFKESDQTLLNTKESVFFPYIQRIREKLDVVWERTLQSRMRHFFNRGGQLATDQDHNTQLLVTLNQAGEVTRVQVLEGSGVRDLDNTAVDAFRMAGPFPNPPKGLLNSQGTVQIRWDLVVFS